MAEARSAVTEPHLVEPIDEEPDTFGSVICTWRKSLFRRIYRTRNSIANGMWPTSLYNLVVTTGLVFFLLAGDWQWAKPITTRIWWLEETLHLHLEGLPHYVRIFLLSATFGLLFFIVLMYVRRYMLRLMLSYRGWLYEPPKGQAVSTLCWGLLVRLISGYHPSMYSYQASLPRMPVPPLRHTLTQLIESLKPLYGADSDYIKSLTRSSKEFEQSVGNKLQRILVAKSWLAQNYVTDWWEKYIYLMGRTPLLINSNYYILDHSYTKFTNNPCARAAVVTYLIMQMKRDMDRETLPPLVIRNTIPLCMNQYERMLHTTRIPGKECDDIVHFDLPRPHLVVFRKGYFYKVFLVDKKGRPLQPPELQQQFEWIVQDADASACEEPHLCALTAWERAKWADIRERYFTGSSTPSTVSNEKKNDDDENVMKGQKLSSSSSSQCSNVNREFIECVDQSMIFLTLDEGVYETMSERGKFGMHGNGANIWADKTVTLLVAADGKVSVNGEHSWADAPVLGHLFEYAFSLEVISPELYYDTEGNAMFQSNAPKGKVRVKHPERLVWECPRGLHDAIETAYSFAVKNNDDLQLVVADHTSYGKGFIKTCQVSPDAYVQIALQLAYYRLHGRFALTYESAMTRLFLCGRTETVRSLTQEVVDFVLAMTVRKVDQGLKVRLFRRACERHQSLYKDAMAGLGIDRHLFALFIAAKGFGYDSDFLHSVLTLPWTLSTSQQPQQQIAWAPSCDLPQYRHSVSPGGGFGPVTDAGYGVSYMVVGDYHIFFHVSSKRSAPETDSEKFMASLFASMEDLKALFDKPESTQKEPSYARHSSSS